MYKEIYFWMATYLRRIKTNKTPDFSAYLILCIFEMLNIGTILVLINYYFKPDFINISSVNLGLAFSAILLALNYFLIYSKRKIIFKEYSESQSKRKITGQIYFWLYAILSFTIFIVAVENLVSPKY